MVAAAAMSDLGFALSLATEERLAPPTSPDVAFARAAARGDKVAFGRLVDLHKRAVFGLCVRLLRDQEEARDAFTTEFASAWGQVGKEDDVNLTRDAKSLKKRLLSLVDRVEGV